MRQILFFVLFITAQLTVAAQPPNERAELERKRKETLREIELLNNQYNEIKKNKKASLGQLAVIQRKLELRNKVINDINKQVNVINRSINTSYVEMRRLQKDLDTLKMNYAQNVVYAYKNRSSYDFLNFLFSASNFNDAVRRIAYMRAYRNYRSQQLDAIAKTEQLYKEKITELTNNRKEKTAVLGEQTKEIGELVKDKNEQAAVVNDIKKRENEISKVLASKRKQAQSLQNAMTALMKRIAAEEDKKRKLAMQKAAEVKPIKSNNEVSTTEKTSSGSATTTSKPEVKVTPTKERAQQAYEELNRAEINLAANFESNKGRLPWPVDNGFVSTPFGRSTLPGNIVWSQEWITISSPIGSSVKAVFDGEVVSISDQNGVTTVAIKHGNYITMYSNLSSLAVAKGQNVTRGSVIGRVDANIEGEGSLEFILIKGQQNLNPTSWLRSR
jgi:murein hydrolase activator